MTDREKLAMALQETVAFHWRSKASSNDDVALDLLIRLRRADLAVVPREATKKMQEHGADHLPVTPGGATNKCAGHVFAAMRAVGEVK